MLGGTAGASATVGGSDGEVRMLEGGAAVGGSDGEAGVLGGG